MAEQKIGGQIEYTKTANELLVAINPAISPKDKMMLNIWLALWTFCGLAVVFQVIQTSYTKEERLFMLIYLVFWIYLELRVLHAFRWNRKGQERIEIKNGEFTYTKLIGKRGLPFSCATADLSEFHYEKSTEKGLWNDINRSFWMVGGEVVQYKFKDKIRRLGMKLPQKDAQKLAELLNKYKAKV